MGAVWADVNWDVLPLSVIVTYCFPLKRSGCEAEKEEEDVCLVSDSAQELENTAV